MIIRIHTCLFTYKLTLLLRPLTAELQGRQRQIWWICVRCCRVTRIHCWFLWSFACQSCSSGRFHKVIFEASISATNHNKSCIMSESQCGDLYLNLWSSGQSYMRSVVYSVKWWPTPTYWIYLLLVFTLIMTLQSTVYRMIILLTFLHYFTRDSIWGGLPIVNCNGMPTLCSWNM